MPKSSASVGRRAPTRPREPKPAEPVALGELTGAEELALAIWLWKSLRCHGAFGGHRGGEWVPSAESVRLGERAIEMARAAGVGAEFFALLFRLKLVKVVLAEME